MLKKCGLEKEAIDNVLPKIRVLEKERKDLRAKLIADRLRGAKMLLMCLCGADLCTELADELVRQAEQDATGKECRIISLEWSPIDTDGWALDWYKRIGFKVKKGCARIGCVRLSKELKK